MIITINNYKEEQENWIVIIFITSLAAQTALTGNPMNQFH